MIELASVPCRSLPLTSCEVSSKWPFRPPALLRRVPLSRNWSPIEVPFGPRLVVSRGDALLAPAITRRLIEQYTKRPAPGAGPPAELEELTARELEVLRLLARGMSNAEIGQELFLSPATAKTHVARVLSKLNLRDRIQAVVLAYESGLVQAGEAD